MSVRVYEEQASAKLNEAVEAGFQGVQSIGPVSLEVHNVGSSNLVVGVKNKSSGARVATDKDTDVADEDTVYDGDTSTLVFSGESLDNTPVIPGTVVVKPAAGGNSVNAIDRDKDGILYTDDVDEDVAGSIDYFTGALELSYPAGKAPNTGDIDCDYSHQDEVLVPGGRRVYAITNVLQEETVLAELACDAAAGGQARINGIATWV